MIIEAYCWSGSNVVILKGVHIGINCVIEANYVILNTILEIITTN